MAVSESDLLTNCHVVGDKTQVLLVRDRQELKATVVSMNINADRCVLRVESKLPKWVGVRPYSDIKVGDELITSGLGGRFPAGFMVGMLACCGVWFPRILARRRAEERRRDPVGAARRQAKEKFWGRVGAIAGGVLGLGGVIAGLWLSGRMG